jgi:hypothetical protein
MLVVALLAACGKDKKENKPRSLTTITQDQIVGQWVDMDANVMQLYEDGSTRTYNLGSSTSIDPEAPVTYTFVTSDNGPNLLLNYSSGSIHSQERPIIDATGCNDRLYSLMMLEDASNPTSYWPVWRVGEASFTPLTSDELSRTWKLFGIPDFEVVFADDGMVTLEERTGEWSLDTQNLSLTWPDQTDPLVFHIYRVERCQKEVILVMLMDDYGNFLIFAHPSITTDIDWAQD